MRHLRVVNDLSARDRLAVMVDALRDALGDDRYECQTCLAVSVGVSNHPGGVCPDA